jgi:hypothetical protein
VEDDNGSGASTDKATLLGNANLTRRDVSELLDVKLRPLLEWCREVQGGHYLETEERVAREVAQAREEMRNEKDTRTKGLLWDIERLKRELRVEKTGRTEAEDRRTEAEDRRTEAEDRRTEAEEKRTEAEARLKRSDEDWRKRTTAKQETYENEVSRLRIANARAMDKVLLAEKEKEVGQKRSRELSGSRDRDGRLDGRREGGREGVPTPARKEHVNVFRDPDRNTITRNQKEGREGRDRGDPCSRGKDGGAEPPGTPGPFTGPHGGKEVPRAREADRGREEREERPGVMERRVSPPVGERPEKAWGGASERTGGEGESVATLPTIVVDLMDTSFDEGGVSAADGSKGKGQESELSEGEESGQEEVPNPDPAVAALSNEEKKAALKERQRVYGISYRSNKKAAKELREGGEGGTAKALVGTAAGKKPAVATLRIEKKKPVPAEGEEAELRTTDETEKVGA